MESLMIARSSSEVSSAKLNRKLTGRGGQAGRSGRTTGAGEAAPKRPPQSPGTNGIGGKAHDDSRVARTGARTAARRRRFDTHLSMRAGPAIAPGSGRRDELRDHLGQRVRAVLRDEGVAVCDEAQP